MQPEAREAMSRHVATALTAALVTTILLTSAATGSASAPGQQPPANVTLPTISGAAVVGNTLTAAPGVWSGKGLSYSYQWLRCDSSGATCGAIGGAAVSTYQPTAADVGARLRVTVIARNKNGSAAATSAATTAVAGTNSAPPPPQSPSFYLSDLSWTSMANGWGPVERDRSNGEELQGDGKTITLNGQTFDKGLGAHAGSDVRYANLGCTRFLASVGVDDEVGNNGSLIFQVYLDGVKAYDSGLMTGTSATRGIDLDTTGKGELRLVVSSGGDTGAYDHADWASARVTCAAAPAPPASPAPTSPSITSIPTISGTAQQGQTLSASTGSWGGSTPMSYTYQWQRCGSDGASCSPVSGATSASYLLASADVGRTMRVSLTASNTAGSATASAAATAVVAAAPAPANPVNGTVLYKADWEIGGLDQWGHQCADNTPVNSAGVQRGTYSAVTGADSGTYAGRFDLPANTTYAQACEALHSRTVGALGSDQYYALAVKFPTNWQEPSSSFWGLHLTQINYEGINGSPLALTAHGDNITFVVNTGACPPIGGSTGCPYYSGDNGIAARNISGGPFYAVPKGQLTFGVWHELIVHVHLALDSTGAIHVWHRVKGGTAWTQTVSASGFPTLQTGTNFGGYIVTASNISTYGTTDKFGAYRGPSSSPLTVYHDNWCRATSFDSATSCLG